jgi:hypothetical protein
MAALRRFSGLLLQAICEFVRPKEEVALTNSREGEYAFHKFVTSFTRLKGLSAGEVYVSAIQAIRG